MPDRILGRLLRPLEKIYRFPGAQKGAPDTFELDLPIQPVHDVSDMAGIRSATAPINDGFWNFTSRLVHTIASNLSTTPSPMSSSVANGFPVDRGGPVPEICWWIYDLWANASNGNCNFAFGAVVHGSATVGPYGTGASAKMQPLFYSNTDTAMGVGTDYIMLQDADLHFPWKFPVRVMENPSGLLSAYNWYQSGSAGATNIDYNEMIWVGPAGVRPPGR